MDSLRHRLSICLGSIALTFLLTLMSVAQTPPQATGTTSSPNPPAATDDGWHFDITPYLWFAGAHGTVGALGREASVTCVRRRHIFQVQHWFDGGIRSSQEALDTEHGFHVAEAVRRLSTPHQRTWRAIDQIQGDPVSTHSEGWLSDCRSREG